MWIIVHYICRRVIHNLWLVESADVELQIWRANFKVICDFLTVQSSYTEQCLRLS